MFTEDSSSLVPLLLISLTSRDLVLVTSASTVLFNEKDFIELTIFEEIKLNALVKKFTEVNKIFLSLVNNICTKDMQYLNNLDH